MSKEMLGPGCGVTVLGRSGLRYREGSESLFVDGEMRNGPADFAIYRSSIRAWEGTGLPIGDAERLRILANIVATFKQEGLEVVVE